MITVLNFYPRSPCGERLVKDRPRPSAGIFLSTLSLRRATSKNRQNWRKPHISIHALLAESDAWNRFTQRRDFISIHALLAESDLWVLRKVPILGIFLSTLSLRRATSKKTDHLQPTSISIHALLAESDVENPLRQIVDRRISIHALLAVSDRLTFYDTAQHTYFYPRSPCGERR